MQLFPIADLLSSYKLYMHLRKVGDSTTPPRNNPLTRSLGLTPLQQSPGLVPRIRDEAGALSLCAQLKESVTPTRWL